MVNLSELDEVTVHIDGNDYVERNSTMFLFIKEYSVFIDVVEKAIRRAINLMESNPKQLNLCEDGITDKIRIALNMAGIIAEHEAMEGGHADLTIKNLKFKWIAEAKIKDKNNGYDWLWKGFLQLTERYSTNAANCNKGGFLVYVKQRNSLQVMRRWKDHMQGQDGYEFSFESREQAHEFISSHSHTKYGTACEISHFCLSAYFDPVV